MGVRPGDNAPRAVIEYVDNPLKPLPRHLVTNTQLKKKQEQQGTQEGEGKSISDLD